jgi:hypothetical protein
MIHSISEVFPLWNQVAYLFPPSNGPTQKYGAEGLPPGLADKLL